MNKNRHRSRSFPILRVVILFSFILNRQLFGYSETLAETYNSPLPFQIEIALGAGVNYWDDLYIKDNGIASTNDFFSKDSSPTVFFKTKIAINNFSGFSINLNHLTNDPKISPTYSMDGFSSYQEVSQQKDGSFFKLPEFTESTLELAYYTNWVKIFFSYQNRKIKQDWRVLGTWDEGDSAYQPLTFVSTKDELLSSTKSLSLERDDHFGWVNQKKKITFGLGYGTVLFSFSKHLITAPAYLKLVQENNTSNDLFTEVEYSGFSFDILLRTTFKVERNWTMHIAIPASVGQLKLSNQFIEATGGSLITYGIRLSFIHKFVQNKNLLLEFHFGFSLEQNQISFGENKKFLQTKDNFTYTLATQSASDLSLPKGTKVNVYTKKEDESFIPFFSVVAKY